MIEQLRTKTRSESGFTLVELLVVMLILGLLASIAIPAFFNQRIKAQDSEAKSIAKTAQTALETFATDRNGLYTGATRTLLKQIEPTLSSATSGANAITTLSVGPSAYTLSVTSAGGNVFSIVRATNGALSYPCTTGGLGGCASGGWG
jgi:type IV pilus assembly protein PilA